MNCASKCIIEVEGIGAVLFERSQKARRLNLSLRADRPVRVALPKGVRLEEGIEFARRRSKWVNKHRARIEDARVCHHDQMKSPYQSDEQGALDFISERTAILSKRYGLPYAGFKVRRYKSIWGSCSAKNIISLNIKLIRLPEEFVDHVILHELAHTRRKNHGPGFWSLMEGFEPRSRELNARMKGFFLEFL